MVVKIPMLLLFSGEFIYEISHVGVGLGDALVVI